MIVERLENWENYFSSGTDWKCVFDFLKTLHPGAEEKEYPLQGNDIFARVMSYETRTPDTAVLEAHRKYIDIQMMIRGTECIKWFPVNDLKVRIPYDTTKDVEFYQRPLYCPAHVNLCPEIFIALFPHDAHMTQLMSGNIPQIVKKVVVKVRKELFTCFL